MWYNRTRKDVATTTPFENRRSSARDAGFTAATEAPQIPASRKKNNTTVIRISRTGSLVYWWTMEHRDTNTGSGLHVGELHVHQHTYLSRLLVLEYMSFMGSSKVSSVCSPRMQKSMAGGCVSSAPWFQARDDTCFVQEQGQRKVRPQYVG